MHDLFPPDWGDNMGTELYNHTRDPMENFNIAHSAPAEVKSALSALLRAHPALTMPCLQRARNNPCNDFGVAVAEAVAHAHGGLEAQLLLARSEPAAVHAVGVEPDHRVALLLVLLHVLWGWRQS